MILDFHTHLLRRNALVDLDPVDLLKKPLSRPMLRPGYLYSVGIHPWNVTLTTPAALRLLTALAAEPQVKAIGECGLDPLRLNAGDPSLGSRAAVIEAQTALLRQHFDLSERCRKPLLLHIVKAFPEIIRLKDRWRPSQPWIIHGFRGKPQLACELLDHGFHLSYGRRFNPASFELTPPSRRLRETDSPFFPADL